MWFLDQIVSWLSSAKDSLEDAYFEVRGWVWPLCHLATPLYRLYVAFYYLAFYFGYFPTWVVDATAKLATILSYSNISSYFKTFFDAASNAWSWVVDDLRNVTNIINTWWSSAGLIVQSWIDYAKQLLLNLISNLSIWLDALQSAWDAFKGMIPSISEIIAWFRNWWGLTLARIISWGGLPAKLIQGLIDSTLLSWFPWYDELAGLWNNIKEFFADPEAWLYKAIDRIIERFW